MNWFHWNTTQRALPGRPIIRFLGSGSLCTSAGAYTPDVLCLTSKAGTNARSSASPNRTRKPTVTTSNHHKTFYSVRGLCSHGHRARSPLGKIARVWRFAEMRSVHQNRSTSARGSHIRIIHSTTWDPRTDFPVATLEGRSGGPSKMTHLR